MSELTRYRMAEPDVPYNLHSDIRTGIELAKEHGVLVPDTTLQDIADAWQKFRGHKEWAPELYGLLDALEGTDDE